MDIAVQFFCVVSGSVEISCRLEPNFSPSPRAASDSKLQKVPSLFKPELPGKGEASGEGFQLTAPRRCQKVVDQLLEVEARQATKIMCAHRPDLEYTRLKR